VEGEDIVSAQYRKIERTPGDDFGVVLADPVSIQNTSESSSAESGRTGRDCKLRKEILLYVACVLLLFFNPSFPRSSSPRFTDC